MATMDVHRNCRMGPPGSSHSVRSITALQEAGVSGFSNHACISHEKSSCSTSEAMHRESHAGVLLEDNVCVFLKMSSK